MSPVSIPRTTDGFIDYAELGALLEHATAADLGSFARKFGVSTDPAMRALASFALFLCSAKCERLAGRIDAAQIQESNADTVYQREIKPEHRW